MQHIQIFHQKKGVHCFNRTCMPRKWFFTQRVSSPPRELRENLCTRFYDDRYAFESVAAASGTELPWIPGSMSANMYEKRRASFPLIRPLRLCLGWCVRSGATDAALVPGSFKSRLKTPWQAFWDLANNPIFSLVAERFCPYYLHSHKILTHNETHFDFWWKFVFRPGKFEELWCLEKLFLSLL